MSSVPEEIYLEILLRTPVRSTFVCKCVCKTWFSIISNPSFVKMHLNLTKQRNSNNPILMLKGCDDENSENEDTSAMYSIGYDTLLLSECADDVFALDDPFKLISNHVDLKGSCNGLVCLSYCIGSEEYICLWNPATKEIKIVPKSPNEYEENHGEIFAFAYDPKADDYKIIIVVVFEEDEDKNVVDVYSLASNSWKISKPSLPYMFPFRREIGEIVNGALHWLCTTPDYYSALVISLDVSDEIFRELKLPKQLVKDKYMPMTVGVLEGCLCILAKVVNVGFEVWLMQDYGVHGSWTKRCIINHERIANTNYLRLMWSFRNGQILLCDCGILVIYDMKHSSVIEPNNFRSLSFYDADTYVESLVSLNSGTYLRGNENQEHEEACSTDVVISQ